MANPITGSYNSVPAALNGAGQAAGQAARPNAPAEARPQDSQLSKDMFLRLMVAQLRNQNPLNPVDGVDFLEQLSQISGVEQMVEMRRELEAIHELLSSMSPPEET